jgi:hypothetical protein
MSDLGKTLSTQSRAQCEKVLKEHNHDQRGAHEHHRRHEGNDSTDPEFITVTMSEDR